MSLSLAVLDSLKAEWDQAIGSYQMAKADLDSAESQLYSWQQYASQDPKDWAEWQAQFSKVNAAKSLIDSAERVVSTVSGWWSSATGALGLSGARMRRQGIASTMGLGFGPLIPAITIGGFLAIVGSIAAITAGIATFITYLMMKKDAMDQISQRVAEIQAADPTLSIADATDIATKQAIAGAKVDSSHSWLTGINHTLMIGLAIAAVVFIAPKFIKQR